MKCARCYRETLGITMSVFNTEKICLECSKKEEEHPKYNEARAANMIAEASGESNFPGIGLPPDLAPQQKFEMGRLVMTTALQNDLNETDTEQGWHDELNLFVSRHLFGDWGDVDANDQAANNRAVVDGDRVLSAYTTTKGIKLWIITEWDRSVTTILRPEDY